MSSEGAFELSLVAWSSPIEFGFVLPLFGQWEGANILYVAICSIPGDHCGTIVGFEPTELRPTNWLPPEKIRVTRLGDLWIDVFKTDEAVFVGTPQELWSSLGKSNLHQFERHAPLTLLDLTIFAERPERERIAKRAFEFVSARFGERRACEWKQGVVRAKLLVGVHRHLVS